MFDKVKSSRLTRALGLLKRSDNFKTNISNSKQE